MATILSNGMRAWYCRTTRSLSRSKVHVPGLVTFLCGDQMKRIVARVAHIIAKIHHIVKSMLRTVAPPIGIDLRRAPDATTSRTSAESLRYFASASMMPSSDLSWMCLPSSVSVLPQSSH